MSCYCLRKRKIIKRLVQQQVWLTIRRSEQSQPLILTLQSRLNVVLTQLGVKPESVIMNVGTAAVGYGYDYVISTMDRIKAAALSPG